MDHARRGIVGTGLGFVVCFITGGLMLGELFGGFADSDAFFVAHYANDDHQLRDLVGATSSSSRRWRCCSSSCT